MSEKHKEKKSLREVLRLLWRFYGAYVTPYRWQFMTVWFFHIAAAAVMMAPEIVIKDIIDVAIPAENMRLVLILSAILVGVYSLNGVLAKIRSHWGHMQALRVTYDLRNRLYCHLQKLAFSFYDNIQTGELLSCLIDDLNTVDEVLYHGPENLVTNGFIVIFTGGMLLWLNWKLALACFIVMPFVFLTCYVVSLKMFGAARDVRKKAAQLSSRAENNLSGMRIIQAFVREEHEQERFRKDNRALYDSRARVIRPMTWLYPVGLQFIGISLAIGFGYGTFHVIEKVMTLGALVAFTSYLRRFMWPLLSLSMLSEGIIRFISGIERFFKYIDMDPDIQDAPDAEEVRNVKGRIEFKDVWFTYDREHILEGVSFTAEAGETVALVGPSGAGKTTITRLLPRFYEPRKGEILLDGTNINSLRISSLREAVSIVMQDDYLFSESLWNNIGYGDLSAEKEDIMRASKLANVHQFADSLPEGYDTEIGERGVKVSEGQGQRISIARAILKDSPILILDEATSSVDSETEKLIQEALDHLMENKTSFVIAHRLSTIIHADKILFVDEGKILEQGTHEELLAQNGKYAHFYRLQYKNQYS